MWPWQTGVFTLTALVFLGGQISAQAPVHFGKPIEEPQDKSEMRILQEEFGLTPPTRAQLFRVQSEASLKERLCQELPNVKNVGFPSDAIPLSEKPASSAARANLSIFPIAVQVCYRPLYFEDKGTERFGQYVPCLQPLISAGRFYADALVLPFRVLLTPPWTFTCDNR